MAESFLERVFVVDDNIDALSTLCALLEVVGYQVLCTHEPAKAIELATKFRPDIMIFDVQMPGINGFELARLMRAHAELKNVPIVALTGFGASDYRRNAAQAGIDAYLTKPSKLDDLRAMIERLTRPPSPAS